MGIQGVAVVLGLLDLRLQRGELLLAGVELPGVRAFEQRLAADDRANAAKPSKANPQPTAPVIGPDRKSPASTNTTPRTNTAAESDQHVDRQQLAVAQMPAPLFQFGLMAGQLVEPLVDLHAAAELRNQIAGPIQAEARSDWPRAARADSICSASV